MGRTGAALVVMALAISVDVSAEPNASTTCDRQLVMQIDSAKISVEPDGIAIDAFGTSSSAGWKNPTLVVSGKLTDDIATVDFVACRPAVSAQVLSPIQAHETLDLPPSTRRIILRARVNSMTVEISH